MRKSSLLYIVLAVVVAVLALGFIFAEELGIGRLKGDLLGETSEEELQVTTKKLVCDGTVACKNHLDCRDAANGVICSCSDGFCK